MNPERLIEHLHGALARAGEPSSRNIVRLKSVREFRACLHRLRKLQSDFPLLKTVRPLPMIRGFACPLRPTASLAEFGSYASVESDEKEATLHTVSKPSAAAEGPNVPWGVKRIRAPQAWAISTGSRIKVGVIDTGVDFNHPDLRDAVSGGINLIHRHLMPIDDNGHGTHISGTIAAASLRAGIIGVAPQAQIYAVKAFDHNGTAYVSDIIQGIEWCVQNRIPIINMSFGMKNYSPALEDAVRRAHRAGSVIVASSGNDGRGGIDYPARFPQTIAVGATTRVHRPAPFSNKSRRIDIYAPGEKIYSTWLRGRYNEMSGTSMATSHVSGVIALMLQAAPRLTPEQIRSMLASNAIRVITRQGTPAGAGEVNAIRTVKKASKLHF